MGLIFCPDCGKSISDSAEICIGCGRPMAKQDREESKAPAAVLTCPPMEFTSPGMAYRKEHTTDSAGGGCVVQAIGLALIVFTFFTFIGPVIGLVLLIYGGQISRAKYYTCGNCGNSIAAASTICPACQFFVEIDPGNKLMNGIKIIILIVCTILLTYFVFFHTP